MTESTTPPPPDEPAADETFTWTDPSASHGDPGPAAGILESVRDAVDDLAERAGPSVREFSARAAELAAIAADRAAPLAKRAGEVTADASGKLATLSRSWAADLRASVPQPTAEPGPATATDPEPGHEAAEPADAAESGPGASGEPTA
jgi:hypothetical protein